MTPASAWSLALANLNPNPALWAERLSDGADGKINSANHFRPKANPQQPSIRERVLNLLRQRGELTLPIACSTLGLPEAPVRAAMRFWVEQGKATYRLQRQPKRRPAYVWVLP